MGGEHGVAAEHGEQVVFERLQLSPDAGVGRLPARLSGDRDLAVQVEQGPVDALEGSTGRDVDGLSSVVGGLVQRPGRLGVALGEAAGDRGQRVSATVPGGSLL